MVYIRPDSNLKGCKKANCKCNLQPKSVSQVTRGSKAGFLRLVLTIHGTQLNQSFF